jgi:hypothetical protein
MTRHCRSCGKDITDRPAKHFLCLRCFGDAARRLKAGETPPPAACGPTCAAIGFDASRATQLIKLAHPDKHGGSDTANDATRWLLQVRDQLTEGERHNG